LSKLFFEGRVCSAVAISKPAKEGSKIIVKESSAELERKLLERKGNVSTYCNVPLAPLPSKENISQNQDVLFAFFL